MRGVFDPKRCILRPFPHFLIFVLFSLPVFKFFPLTPNFYFFPQLTIFCIIYIPENLLVAGCCTKPAAARQRNLRHSVCVRVELAQQPALPLHHQTQLKGKILNILFGDRYLNILRVLCCMIILVTNAPTLTQK